MSAVAARHWDRDGRCCKPACLAPLGTTSQGVKSVHCQEHTDAWEARLAKLQADRMLEPATAGPGLHPVFEPPAPPLDDVMACARCGQAPREWPDQLCEDCRHG